MALKRNYRETENPAHGTGGLWTVKEAMQPPSGKKNGIDGMLTIYLASKMQIENPFNADYLRRLKERDQEVTDHFGSYFRSRLTLKLRGHGLRRDVVEDLVQETLLQVLKSVEKEEIHTPAAFGGFVSRVCDFVYYDWLERNKKLYASCVDVDEFDIPDPAPGHDTLLVRRERQKLVAAILESLRPKDRNLLRAKLFDELSPEEMCKRFGVSHRNLRVLLHRARKKFASAWKKRN